MDSSGAGTVLRDGLTQAGEPQGGCERLERRGDVFLHQELVQAESECAQGGEIGLFAVELGQEVSQQAGKHSEYCLSRRVHCSPALAPGGSEAGMTIG